MNEKVTRTDFLDLIFREGPSKLVTTPEGFKTGTACVTNIGIFPYMLPDGTIRNELRLPEEVFHPESMASLNGKPLTDDHPDEIVNPDNVQALMVGALGSEASHDDQCVYMPLTFHRRDALDNIQNGKRALSCGYTCELEFVSGTKWGQHYDAIQRVIRYNHVALVDKGRAGEDAVLRMDGAGWSSSLKVSTNPHHDGSNTMKTIHLDGVGYQADEAVISALQTAKADAKTATDALATAKADAQTKVDEAMAKLAKADEEKAKVQAEFDACSANLKKAEADLDETKKKIPAMCDEAIKTRLSILDAASLAGVEIKAEMSHADAVTAILAKVAPDVKADAEPAYIKARFDIAIDGLRKDKTKGDAGRQSSVDVPGSHVDGAPVPGSLAEAKVKHDAALADAWRDPKPTTK